MATTIKLKNGSGAPTAGDLVQGEPALDLTNKRLYTEDAGGSVIEVGTNPSALSIAGTAVTATATELNVLDGITSTTAELNILDGVTATASELNVLDGITATTTELNYTDGVTSNIQTQLNAKAPIDAATFTGTTTIPTADINGGAIDGVTLGTNSAVTEAQVDNININGNTISSTDTDGNINITPDGTGAVVIDGLSYPTADGTDGQVLTTDGAGTLTFESVGGTSDKIEEGNSSVEVVDTGTGYVAVTVDGSETARFDANGRLGIGTTSPSQSLHVSGEGYFQKNSADSVVTLSSNGGSGRNWQVRSQASGDFFVYDGTSGSSSLTIDSSANLKFNSGYGSVATAYGCRAWVNFNGSGTVAIRGSGNVSSITDNGTGDYTVNFTTAMPNTNYSVNMNAGVANVLAAFSLPALPSSTSSIVVRPYNDSATAYVDSSSVNVAIFR